MILNVDRVKVLEEQVALLNKAILCHVCKKHIIYLCDGSVLDDVEEKKCYCKVCFAAKDKTAEDIKS